MGCRCGKNSSAPPPNTATPKSAMPARPPQSPRPPVLSIRTELKFCEKCGWMLAKVSYVDVNTKQRIQKYTCPNHQCSNYNR